MLSLLRKPRSEARPAAPAQPRHEPDAHGAAQQVVRSIAAKVSHIGRDAAETRGVLDDTQKVVSDQVAAMHQLNDQFGEVLSREQDQPTHLAVDVRLHDGVWMPVRLNADFQAPHLRWKQVLRCQD